MISRASLTGILVLLLLGCGPLTSRQDSEPAAEIATEVPDFTRPGTLQDPPCVTHRHSTEGGVATLVAMLEGFEIPASYDEIRDRLKPDYSGVSIDDMEELAIEKGLVVAQMMAPVEHVLLRPEAFLPAITIRHADHDSIQFTLLWRTQDGKVEVMDPTGGSTLWWTEDQLRAATYIHEMEVPSHSVLSYMSSAEFVQPLKARAIRIGVPLSSVEKLIQSGRTNVSSAIGWLDAWVRQGESAPGTPLPNALFNGEYEASVTPPEHFWTARASSKRGLATLRGAVLLSATRRAR